MKKQNGITLIALIITIIVLLILAVVTIGAVQDSDIIGHAEDAAKKYNAAAEEEKKLLENYVKEIEGVLPKTEEPTTIETVIAQLNADEQANPTKYTDVGGVGVTATDGTNLWCSSYSFEDRPHIFWEVIYDEITSRGCIIDSSYTTTKTFAIDGNDYDITYLVAESLSIEPADPNDEEPSEFIVTLPVTFKEAQTNILFDLEIVDGEDYKVDNFRLAE